VYPIINGLRVNTEHWIYYNARNGALYGVTRISGHDFIVPDYAIDTAIKITPENGLKGLNISDREKYIYSETLIVRSILYDKYVPVHLYKNETRILYVNAITGKQELLY
jgi:hypothetical protein